MRRRVLHTADVVDTAAPSRLQVTMRRVMALALIAVATACTLTQLREETRTFDNSTVLAGRVTLPAGGSAPVCVSAIEHGSSPPRVSHQVWLHQAGGYELLVPRGRYDVAAFADLDGNGRHDAGEPAARTGDPVAAEADGVVTAVDLQLEPMASPGAAPPWPAERARHSTQAGALADLNAPFLGGDAGSMGYWAPISYFRQFGGNVYLLEPYDPSRVPVLFVHGAAGSPQDFRELIGRLDRRRYQAWVYAYPSGSSLESMAYLLYWKLFNLQIRHRFQTLHVVAHSMGGLVARRFMIDHGSQFPQLGAFITLSTPWGGEPSAELGVKRSPAVVPSWRDMQPHGAFVQTLFERRLPTAVSHYLLFSHRGAPGLTRPNNDGSVTLASQLRVEAQTEARLVMGFDEDHTSVLVAPDVIARVRGLLDGAGARRLAHAEGAAGEARATVRFEVAGSAAPPRSQPVLILAPTADSAAPTAPPLFIPLGSDDSGRSIGPLPLGRYDVSLVAEAYSSVPQRQTLVIRPGSDNLLSVRLSPQGTLTGYVAGARTDVRAPAGSYRAPDARIQITSIELSGEGVHRRLVPGADDVLSRYIDGQDAVRGAQFAFVGLPEGRYTLCIEALRHRRSCSTHDVVLGRSAPFAPIELDAQP